MSLKSSSSSCSDISIDEIQSREETGMLMTHDEILEILLNWNHLHFSAFRVQFFAGSQS